MVYKVLLVGNLHHKNENAVLKYKNISVDRVDGINDSIDLSLYHVVFSPGVDIDVSLYPEVKFIFGPHFSVFPEEYRITGIKGPNSIYVQPSQWVVDLWKSFHFCNDMVIKSLPFGVDTDLFSPMDCQKEEVFIYYKRRHPEELNYLQDLLDRMGISYRVFVYGTYSECEYLDYLQRCKYGIWLGAHESQGFALQEALSMNVPLFVLNVVSLNQETESFYPDIFATSIPYWDPMCGEVVYSWEELCEKFFVFLSRLKYYTPREFVIKELSLDICEKRFIELFC
jgi:hypothetical protein